MTKILIDDNFKENKIVFNKNDDISIDYSREKSLNLEFIIKEDIIINLLEFSCNNKANLEMTYSLEENAILNVSKIYNNEEVKEDITINLNGEKSKINYNFITVSTSEENYIIKVNHLNKNTKSDIVNKAVTLEEGEVFIQIDSNLPNGVKSCSLNQLSRIVPFNSKKSTVVPNMFIEEYHTEAKHGSVIGNFKEEEIFYLMTRGLARANAINLLVKGFVLGGLKLDMEYMDKVLKIINKYWRWNNE